MDHRPCCDADWNLPQPPTPVLDISKTDGASVAPAGSDLTYGITITNPSSGSAAGAAHSVVVTDEIPTNSTFVACTVVLPATGSCSESSNVVTATLDGWIHAGGSARVEVTVLVDPDASGTVANDASVAFEDVLGNRFPAVTASDVDSVGPPAATPGPTPSASIALLPNTSADTTPTFRTSRADLGALLVGASFAGSLVAVYGRRRRRSGVSLVDGPGSAPPAVDGPWCALGCLTNPPAWRDAGDSLTGGDEARPSIWPPRSCGATGGPAPSCVVPRP